MGNVIIRSNGRTERNNINYRCNYRLKYGNNKCDNDSMVEESFIIDLIKQQLYVINLDINNVDIISIIKEIIVTRTRVEISFKNLPIDSCYADSKIRKLHFDTLTP